MSTRSFDLLDIFYTRVLITTQHTCELCAKYARNHSLTLCFQWRYTQFASKFLLSLVRRDAPVSAPLAKFFAKHCTSPHASIRSTAHKYVPTSDVFLYIL